MYRYVTPCTLVVCILLTTYGCTVKMNSQRQHEYIFSVLEYTCSSVAMVVGMFEIIQVYKNTGKTLPLLMYVRVHYTYVGKQGVTTLLCIHTCNIPL